MEKHQNSCSKIENNEEPNIETSTTSSTDVGEIADTFEGMMCAGDENEVIPQLIQVVSTDEVTNTTDERRDPQMTELLRKLREKYSGHAKNAACFPDNPNRQENAQYIQFDSPPEEGRTGWMDWCRCGQSVMMPTNLESICCMEIENAQPYIQGKACITEHEFFQIFCTREDTVNITLRSIGEFKKPPPKKDEKRLCRKTAYRAFTAWVHGYLGIGNRRPIPSCVVNKVCFAFPEPTGEYMGFIPMTNDSPAEFMAFE